VDRGGCLACGLPVVFLSRSVMGPFETSWFGDLPGLLGAVPSRSCDPERVRVYGIDVLGARLFSRNFLLGLSFSGPPNAASRTGPAAANPMARGVARGDAF